jgi:hypothetical protein
MRDVPLQRLRRACARQTAVKALRHPLGVPLKRPRAAFCREPPFLLQVPFWPRPPLLAASPFLAASPYYLHAGFPVFAAYESAQRPFAMDEVLSCESQANTFRTCRRGTRHVRFGNAVHAPSTYTADEMRLSPALQRMPHPAYCGRDALRQFARVRPGRQHSSPRQSSSAVIQRSHSARA